MGTKNISKNGIVVSATQLIAGTAKHLTNATQVTLVGGSYTAAQIESKLACSSL